MAGDNRMKIAEILLKADGEFVSGEDIAEETGISRAAVWKHIKNLRDNGYDIESVNRKGYRIISTDKDRFIPERISSDIETEFIGKNIKFFDSLDSTNTYCLEHSEELEDGSIVIAKEQTVGKGRLGRVWKSRPGDGIWMSIILKPEIPLYMSPFMTLISGAAIVEALEKFGVDAGIKWPNDIILNGKKLCGILTEMKAQVERIECIVTGMGINTYTEKFPDELKEKATSLKIEGYEINGEELIKEILTSFEKMYMPYVISGNKDKALEICRKKSVLIGKKVRVIEKGETEEVECINIDDNGNLIVKKADGTEKRIFSGEVSVRGENGYV